ncbi:MAG: hypothetical protein V3S31_03525 [Dehalococcoidia bacterium]
MRFTRGDLPGIAIALLGGPALFLLFLASYDVWDHRGTPLLGAMATNFALAVGLAAVFSRFIRHWPVAIALVVVLLAVVGGVIWLQQTDNDGTTLATTLKLIGVADFALLNVVVGGQIVWFGLIPVMDRRSARVAGEQ